MGRRRRRGGAGVAIAAVLVALLAAGGGTGVFLMWRHSQIDVTVNGTEVRMPAKSTVADAKERLSIAPPPGRLIAIDGSVISEDGGTAQTLTVDGSVIEGDDTDSYALADGMSIEIADGTDKAEDVTEEEVRTPYGEAQDEGNRDRESYWAGAIHRMSDGQEGITLVRTGAVSGISQTQEVQAPVDSGYSVYSAHPDEKVVALTFDDGPWAGTTDEILDILEENGAKATFFVIGNQVADHADSVRRARDLGCLVCTHTWDHAAGSGQGVNLTYMDADEQVEEVTRGMQAISDALGEEAPRYMRAPGGNLYGSVINTLWPYIDAEFGWDLDTEDWRRPGSDAIEEVIMSAQPGSVILMHDGGGDRSQTVEAVRRAVPQLKAQGYRFVTVDELLAYPAS